MDIGQSFHAVMVKYHQIPPVLISESGIIKLPLFLWGDQTMQPYGHLQGFPFIRIVHQIWSYNDAPS